MECTSVQLYSERRREKRDVRWCTRSTCALSCLPPSHLVAPSVWTLVTVCSEAVAGEALLPTHAVLDYNAHTPPRPLLAASKLSRGALSDALLLLALPLGFRRGTGARYMSSLLGNKINSRTTSQPSPPTKTSSSSPSINDQHSPQTEAIHYSSRSPLSFHFHYIHEATSTTAETNAQFRP